MFYLNSSKRNRYTNAALVAFILSWPNISFALATDADQPIHIEGDNAEIDQSRETITYTGSVEIVQGTLRVHGDKMVVKVKGEQVVRITTVGSPAHYEQQLEEDEGQVKAHANSIIYHTAEERIYLNGEAMLTQHGNKLLGESIRYDMVNGKVDASAGNSSGRVRMTLDPKNPPAKLPADPN